MFCRAAVLVVALAVATALAAPLKGQPVSAIAKTPIVRDYELVFLGTTPLTKDGAVQLYVYGNDDGLKFGVEVQKGRAVETMASVPASRKFQAVPFFVSQYAVAVGASDTSPTVAGFRSWATQAVHLGRGDEKFGKVEALITTDGDGMINQMVAGP